MLRRVTVLLQLVSCVLLRRGIMLRPQNKTACAEKDEVSTMTFGEKLKEAKISSDLPEIEIKNRLFK